MNILIVGNVTKDVYLNLDSRTEKLETDKNGTAWLDLSFDASDHRFFSRFSTFGGAAITMEVLTKLGQTATITNSSFSLSEESDNANINATHRYIITAPTGVSYFAPSTHTPTIVPSLTTAYDCIFIDRSAELTEESVTTLRSYFEQNPSSRLVIYAKDSPNSLVESLLPFATLIFLEKSPNKPENSTALPNLPEKKTIYLSPTSLKYLNITETFSVDRIDRLTHLSVYSIATATIIGSFMRGKTIEESFRLAKINVENSTIESTLSLDELENLHTNTEENLELIAASLVRPGKGILAADESGGSIEKKFANLNIPDTFDNRHSYRNIFFTTPDIENHLTGVILFDETARDYMDDGEPIPDFLISRRIVPGIKVDQGLAPLSDLSPNYNPEETYTKGLDGLEQRLREYYQMGLRFAKWRAAFKLTLSQEGYIITPTDDAISENCHILAKYALKCQSAGLVPIVEPELIYDGNYPIEKSAEVTAKILDVLFRTLQEYHVNLKACILKVNMVLAGKKQAQQSSSEEVGEATASVLKAHVPKELAGIVFLSGGQTPEQATDNLAAIVHNGPFDWPVTFSFARALQDPALYAWQGNNDNQEKAQAAFKERLELNTNALKLD